MAKKQINMQTVRQNNTSVSCNYPILYVENRRRNKTTKGCKTKVHKKKVHIFNRGVRLYTKEGEYK